MFKVSRSLVNSIIALAKNSFPKEFAALLSSSTQTNLVDEFIAIPSIKGETHVLIQEHLIPVDFQVVGTVHSHPSGHAFPSREDKKTFSKTGSFNLIIGFPFEEKTINAFDRSGRKISFKIVDF